MAHPHPNHFEWPESQPISSAEDTEGSSFDTLRNSGTNTIQGTAINQTIPHPRTQVSFPQNSYSVGNAYIPPHPGVSLADWNRSNPLRVASRHPARAFCQQYYLQETTTTVSIINPRQQLPTALQRQIAPVSRQMSLNYYESRTTQIVLQGYSYPNIGAIPTNSGSTNSALRNATYSHIPSYANLSTMQHQQLPQTQAVIPAHNNETHNSISYNHPYSQRFYPPQGYTGTDLTAGTPFVARMSSQPEDPQGLQEPIPLLLRNQAEQIDQTPEESINIPLDQVGTQQQQQQHQESSTNGEHTLQNVGLNPTGEQNDSKFAIPNALNEGAIRRPRRMQGRRSGQGTFRYLCPKCPDHFSIKASFLRHLHTCHPKEPRKYPCLHCSSSFESSISRTAHGKRAHPEKTGQIPEGQAEMRLVEGIPRFFCCMTGCKKSYVSLPILNRHIKMHHTKTDTTEIADARLRQGPI